MDSSVRWNDGRGGFSLVELSIVLVILGLLVGGILAGQSLIRAAEVRSVMTDYTRFSTAVHTFRDKYFYLPGDIPNAASIWGAADGGDGAGTDCRDTVSTTATTCNGDGDGWIRPAGSTATNVHEYFRAWQHLANAGLIEGRYIGTNATLAGYSQGGVPGVSNPSTKISSVHYWSMLRISATASTTAFTQSERHTVIITTPTGASLPLTPEELWNIDTKMDDGKPALGKVIATKGDATLLCTDRANQAADPALDTAALYNLSAGKEKYCSMWFML